MTAPEIVTYLVRQGYTVDFELPDVVSVSPTPTPTLIERIASKEPELVEYFRSLEARPASGHAFVTMAGMAKVERDRNYMVCLSCGKPWGRHGEPPESAWDIVDTFSSAELLTAAAIDSGAE